MDDLNERLRKFLEWEQAQRTAKDTKPERPLMAIYDEWLSLLDPLSNTTKSRRSFRSWLDTRFTLGSAEYTLGSLTPSQASLQILTAWQNMMSASVSVHTGRLLTPGTVDQIRMAVQAMFQYAVQTGEIRENPLRLKVPRLKERDRKREGYLTAEQVELVARQLPFMDAAIFRHMFATAARIGAIRLLRKSEIHERERQLIVRSKGRKVVIFVPSKTLEEMLRLCALSPSEYVYPNPMDPTGQPIPVSTLVRRRERAFQTAGIVDLNGERPCAHHGRHGKAMETLEKTGDITLVQKMLGHARITETLRYALRDGHQADRLRRVLDEDT